MAPYMRCSLRPRLLLEWTVGVVVATTMMVSLNFATLVGSIRIGAHTTPWCVVMASPIVNIVVLATLTPIFKAIVRQVADEMAPADHREA